MATKFIVTTAGLAALADAVEQGTTVTLSEIRLADGQYTPTADQTALRGAVLATLTGISGGNIGDNIIHLETIDNSSSSYRAYEVGIFTTTGVLFGVASDASDPIIEKAPGANAIMAVDFALASDISQAVTVSGVTYHLPPATTENQGVVELATEAETDAGTDNTRAVTPLGLAAVVLKYLPLTGGVMRGPIRWQNGSAIIESSSIFRLSATASGSGESGAYLNLYQRSQGGYFALAANGEAGSASLIGRTDGRLSFKDKALSGYGFPNRLNNIIELSTTITSGAWLTAPADGWAVLVYDAAVAEEWIVLITEDGYEAADYSTDSSCRMHISVPVRKGRKFQPAFNGRGTFVRFNFIYADGAV